MKPISLSIFFLLSLLGASFPVEAKKEESWQEQTTIPTTAPDCSPSQIGRISTVATGLENPFGVTVDKAGNIYFSESYPGNRIRKIDTNKLISTVAKGLENPFGVGVDDAGNIYFSEPANGRIQKVDTSGMINAITDKAFNCLGEPGPAPTDALCLPTGVAVGVDGNLYIEDAGDVRIQKIDRTTGITSGFAGNGHLGFSGDGGPAIAAELSLDPLAAPGAGLAFASNGDIYIADSGNHRVRKVDTSGIITTVAGGGSPADGLRDNGPATTAELRRPTAVAVGADGNLYIADTMNDYFTSPTSDSYKIRKVGADGIMTTVVGGGSPADGLGDGRPATDAKLSLIRGMAFDANGSLYITDTGYNRIRKVSCLAPPHPISLQEIDTPKAVHPFVHPSLPVEKSPTPSRQIPKWLRW